MGAPTPTTGPRRPVSLAMTPSALGSARTNKSDGDDELEEERTAAAATAASESVEKKRGILLE